MKYKLLLFILGLTLFACKSTQKPVQHHETNDNTKIKEKFAQLLSVNSDEIINIPLYSFVNEWIGVKYEYGGLSKKGVDCSGFCNLLYQNVYKKQLPRSSADIARELKKVSKDKLEEGDILVFDIEGKKNSHVGVYLTNNKFVHSSTSKGVIISSLEHPYYQKAFSKAGQL